jgi:hypothetical protein
MFTYWAYHLRDAGPFLTWIAGGVLLYCLQLAISINEREHWAPRVARTIPRQPWLRVPSFLLYSGAAGGVIFSLLGVAFTLLIGTVTLERLTSWRSSSNEALKALLLIGLYTFSYALTAVLVRTWWSTSLKPVHTWVMMAVIVAIGSAVPYIIGFMLYFSDWHTAREQYWLIANPFYAPFDWRHHDTYLTFAGIWAAIVALLSIPWFVQQIRRFRPYGSASA